MPVEQPTNLDLLNAINSNKKAIEGNRRAIEGNRKAIEGSSKDIKGLKEYAVANDRTHIIILKDLWEQGKRLKELDDRTVNIPQLYNNIDKLYKEVLEIRQEYVFINNRLSKLERAGT